MSLLSCHHSKVIPGLWIAGAQLQCLLEILPSLRKIMSLKAERAQVVISLRIVRLRGDHLLKGRGRFVQIAVLKHRDAIREVIAEKSALVERPVKWQRSPHALGCRRRNKLHTFPIPPSRPTRNEIGIGRSLRRSKR